MSYAETDTISKKQKGLFALFFFLAFFFQVFSQGIFWDDWAIIYHSPEENIAFFKELGFFAHWPAHVYNALYQTPIGIFLNRLITFLCFLGAAVFLERSLRLFKTLSAGDRYLIVLFFALFPVNFGRTILNQIHYAICYLAYFAGLFFILKYEVQKGLWRRLLALALLFFSFSMNSVLFFHAVTFLALMALKKDQPWKKIILGILAYADLILLPLVFWHIKLHYFSPTGFYNGYNQVSADNLLSAVAKLPDVFTTSFKEVVWNNSLLELSLVRVVIIFALSTWMFREFQLRVRAFRENLIIGILGILVFFIGAYPYLVVLKMPSFDNFSTSGFQILLPLGGALMLFAMMSAFNSYLHHHAQIHFKIGKTDYNAKSLMSFLTCLLVLSFVSSNYRRYYHANLDWFKHKTMGLRLQDYPELEQHTTFVIDDTSRHDFNAFKRHTIFYEVTGLMKKYLGHEKHYAFMNYAYQTDWLDFDVTTPPIYWQRHNMKDYQKAPPTALASFTILDGFGGKFWSLFWNDLFNEKAFAQMARKFSHFTVRPFKNDDIKSFHHCP